MSREDVLRTQPIPIFSLVFPFSQIWLNGELTSLYQRGALPLPGLWLRAGTVREHRGGAQLVPESARGVAAAAVVKSQVLP